MYYTLGRVWIEAMRIDDAEQISLFGITTRLNVWTSILVFAGALLAFILLGLRKRSEPDTVFLPGREPAEAKPVETAAAESKAAETETDAAAVDAGRTTGATGAAAGPAAVGAAAVVGKNDAERDAEGERTTVPAEATTIRHADSAVSDSESRANLRNNQSGPVPASEDADKDSTGGTAPATGAPAAGVSGRQGTGSAPEAEGTK
jgi:hypothetical protein